MQRQIEISHELVRLMNREHEQRSLLFQHLHGQLDEKDRIIKKLEATIEAMRVVNGK